MTNKKQNEVIAIADGFTSHEYKLYASGFGSSVPDYDSDNEMDRMVRGLEDKEFIKYAVELQNVVGVATGCHLVDVSWEMLRAAAAQKKEAFIKAKGELIDE